MSGAGDAEVVRDLAMENAAARGVVTVVPDDVAPVLGMVLPPDFSFETLDTEAWAETPRRPSGTVQVHDATGFVRSVNRRAGEFEGGRDVVLYADEERKALVAILNDDGTAGGDMLADWRDYRIELALRPRPEWLHWKGKSGAFLDQQKFAEHIEDGLLELVSPPAADAIELAQSFEATSNARFKSGVRLHNGVTQFAYEEDVDAKAGAGGLLAIPTELKLLVAPFYGSARFEVTARFRYRLPRGGGNLELGYVLNRPDDVERAAFTKIADVVAAELALDVIAGVAPSPRTVS